MIFNFGKKGNVQELVTILIVVFALTVTILVVGKIIFAFNDGVQRMNNKDIPDAAKSISQTITNKTPSILDNFLFMIMIVIYLVALISAWFIDTNPVFFVISVIILIIVLIIAGIIQNANEAILSAEAFSDIALLYPKMIFIGQNLFKIISGMGILLLASLYAKSRSGQA